MSPLEQLEELMGALEKTRQELDTTKLHLSSTQQSLHERDRHLHSLRQDRRKQLQEILEMKLVPPARCTCYIAFSPHSSVKSLLLFHAGMS